MDNLSRRIVSGFAWQGASKVVVQSISWVGTIVVARLLAPADYGLMAVAAIFIGVLTLIVEMGLSQGLVQKTTTTREQEDAVFWLGIGLAIGLYGLLFYVAPAIAGFYNMPVLTNVLRVSGLVLLIGSLKSVPVAVVMRRLDFRYRAVTEVAATLTTTIVVLALAVNDYGVWSLVWGSLAHQTILAVAYLPQLGRFPRLVLSWRAVSPVITYGVHVMGGNLAFAVSNRADVFILGKVLGEHVTGIYSLAFQLATIPLDKIGTVFNHVAFPALSRAKNDAVQCRALFLEFHRYLLFIAYPVLVGLALVAEDAVVVLLTEKWLPIVPVLQGLCVINALRVSGMIITPLLNSRGHVNWTLRYSIAGMVLLPLAFLIGAQFGLMGVVVAWGLTYPFLYLLLLHYLRRDLGVTLGELIASGRSTLVATAGMGAAVVATQLAGVEWSHGIRLLAGILAGALAYSGIFLIFYAEQVAQVRAGWRLLRNTKGAEA